MTRMEVIFNNTVKEDLLEELAEAGLGNSQSTIPLIEGVGSSGPRLGTVVWPGTNGIMLLYMKEESVGPAQKAVRNVKEKFPTEGIRAYLVRNVERVI